MLLLSARASASSSGPQMFFGMACRKQEQWSAQFLCPHSLIGLAQICQVFMQCESELNQCVNED